MAVNAAIADYGKTATLEKITYVASIWRILQQLLASIRY